MKLKILEHSDFGAIRTTTDEKGNVLFCGTDVATALGYAKPNNAVKTHCRATLKQGSPISGKIQDINFIYEPDLYRLIIKSKLPAAVEFERWVFEDVLPSIRKHGMYANDVLLNDPELLWNMARQIKGLQEETINLIEANVDLEHEKEVLTEIVADYEEMADYVEHILKSDCALTPTQIGADYGITAHQLNQILHRARVQRKVGGQWVLYRAFMNMGLTNSETHYRIGARYSCVSTKWTQKGRLLIHEILMKSGIFPVNSSELERGYWRDSLCD